MNIFVTGGTGFMGKPTVKLIASRGHKVLVLSRLLPKKDGSRELLKIKNVRFIKSDLANLNSVKEKIRKFRPDAVMHLAWEGIPNFSSAMSMKNLKNGLDLIRFVVSIPCKRVVCVGSDKEYGIPVGKVDESTGLHPMSAFSAAKTALHWIGREIAKENGVQFVWTRIFFVYGPEQRPASLIPYLMRCIETGESPKIRNIDGANDFVYVDDVARALVMLAEKRSVKNDLYNIASGRLTSVRDIVNIVYGKKTSGRRPKENNGSYADISRIKKDIGWSPKTNIKSGIRKIATYNKRNHIWSP